MIRAVIAILLALTITADAGSKQSLLQRAWASRGGAVASVGTAMYFNGVNQSLKDATTNLLTGASNATYMVWMYQISNPSQSAYLLGVPVSATQGLISYGYGGWAASCFLNTSVSTPYTSILPSNSWRHVVGVVDASAQRVYIYVDCVRAQSGGASGQAIGNMNGINIGAYIGVSSRYYNGLIDEAVIWNRALSSNEVVELYNGGNGRRADTIANGTNGMLRLWHFDEPAGSTQAVDSITGAYLINENIKSTNWVTGKVMQ